MISLNDLSDWLGEARKINELVVVDGATVDLEAGIIDRINARNRGPAVVFQNIPGYSHDFRLATNLLGNTRTINLTFGLPTDNTLRDTVTQLRDKMPHWKKRRPSTHPEL
jgi:UbiD family decarboxylase